MVDASGDTTPCEVTPVMLHGVVFQKRCALNPQPCITFGGKGGRRVGSHLFRGQKASFSGSCYTKPPAVEGQEEGEGMFFTGSLDSGMICQCMVCCVPDQPEFQQGKAGRTAIFEYDNF